MPTHVDALLRADCDVGGGSGGTAGPVNLKATRRRFALAAGLTIVSAVQAHEFNTAIPDFYSKPGFVPHRQYNSDQATESIDVLGGGLQVEGSP